jgi:hypothetical protein
MAVILALGFSEVMFGVGITILVVLLLGGIVFSVSETMSNKRQAVETFRVKVVAKRTLVQGGVGNAAASTEYFVTFEHKGGFREEVPVSGEEYGLIAEGDRGTISRQGTWFKGFERSMPTNG